MTGSIQSKDNPLVKRIVKLKSSAKARREEGLFLIEGQRLCSDALQSGVALDTVLYTDRFFSQKPEVVEALSKKAGHRYEISEDVAVRLTDTQTPQGIFCVCPVPEKSGMATTIGNGGNYIALEDVADPSNLGMILRTAEALGLCGVIVSKGCCDIYSPKVLRGSMGAVFRLKCIEVASMINFVRERVEAGQRVFAAVPDRDAASVLTVDFSGGSVILIGNEAEGLRPETIQAATLPVTIPMNGKAESLNAAAAATILMWQAGLRSAPMPREDEKKEKVNSANGSFHE